MTRMQFPASVELTPMGRNHEKTRNLFVFLLVVVICALVVGSGKLWRVSLYPSSLSEPDLIFVSSALDELGAEYEWNGSHDGFWVQPEVRAKYQVYLAKLGLPAYPTFSKSSEPLSERELADLHDALGALYLTSDIHAPTGFAGLRDSLSGRSFFPAILTIRTSFLTTPDEREAAFRLISAYFPETPSGALMLTVEGGNEELSNVDLEGMGRLQLKENLERTRQLQEAVSNYADVFVRIRIPVEKVFPKTLGSMEVKLYCNAVSEARLEEIKDALIRAGDFHEKYGDTLEVMNKPWPTLFKLSQ